MQCQAWRCCTRVGGLFLIIVAAGPTCTTRSHVGPGKPWSPQCNAAHSPRVTIHQSPRIFCSFHPCALRCSLFPLPLSCNGMQVSVVNIIPEITPDENAGGRINIADISPDIDQDGVVEPHEQQIYDRLKAADTDNDGYLSRKEMFNALREKTRTRTEQAERAQGWKEVERGAGVSGIAMVVGGKQKESRAGSRPLLCGCIRPSRGLVA